MFRSQRRAQQPTSGATGPHEAADGHAPRRAEPRGGHPHNRKSMAPLLPRQPPAMAFRLVATVIAAAIFYLDLLSNLDIAIAVMYVAVILLFAAHATRRELLMVGGICAGLTIIAFATDHVDHYSNGSLARCIFSLAAITVTTLLAERNRRVMQTLLEQASLLDLSNDAIIVRDMHDRVLVWNNGAQTLYGYRRDQALGQGCHDLLSTQFGTTRDDVMQALLLHERWEGELVQRCADGSEVVVASRWALRRDSKGVAHSILESATDIRERKRIETQIRQQEQELRTALDAIPVMAWISNTDGQVEYVNARWRERGYMGTHTNTYINELVHSDDRAHWIEKSIHARRHGEAFGVEARLFDRERTPRWFLHRAEPLRNADGVITRWYGVSIDIDDRRQAEQALNDTKQELRKIVDTIPTYLWLARPDPEPVIEAINDRWSELGISPDDVLGTHWHQIVHPDDLPDMHKAISQAIGTRTMYESIARWRLGNGDYHWMLARALPLYDDHGNVIRWYGTMNDIEELRRTEDALLHAQHQLAHAARIATLGELSASIAHEVNQPLAAIMTNGDASLRWLNRESPDLDEVHDGLTSIVDEARRASTVIQRLRAMTARNPEHRVPLSCAELAGEALALVKRQALMHEVRTELDCEPDLPMVRGDRVQLQQVLINLLVNAIQAMTDRPGVHEGNEVRLVVKREDDRHVRFCVHDTGKGIRAEHLESLFNAFFTTKEQGMGMGLSICRTIIRAHEGRIWAESQPDQHTRVQFVLPVSGETS